MLPAATIKLNFPATCKSWVLARLVHLAKTWISDRWPCITYPFPCIFLSDFQISNHSLLLKLLGKMKIQQGKAVYLFVNQCSDSQIYRLLPNSSKQGLNPSVLRGFQVNLISLWFMSRTSAACSACSSAAAAGRRCSSTAAAACRNSASTCPCRGLRSTASTSATASARTPRPWTLSTQ